MSIIGTIYEDTTTDVMGVIGSWQWLVTFVSMTFSISTMLNQYENAYFLEPPSDIECDLPDTIEVTNSSLCTFTFKNSTTRESCSKWRLKILWIVWMKKKWLIHCDQKSNLLSTTVICRLGLVFGYLIFGVIADSFGRKQILRICVIADLGFQVAITFCDMESWFHLLIFLRSIVVSASSYVGLVLVCEIASNGWRTVLTAISSSPRLLATVLVVPLVNMMPNFETFNTITSGFSLIVILLLRLVPESPQWLLYNKKIPHAEKVLFKAAKTNGIELDINFKIRPVNHIAYVHVDKTWSCIEVLIVPNIRTLTLAILTFWTLYNFLWCSIYIRIYKNSDQYFMLKTLSFIIFMGCMNICVSKKLKLAKMLIVNIMFIALSNMTVVLLRRLAAKQTINNIVSHVTLSTGVMVHALILNITPRLFSIHVRATMFGLCHSAGQLGAIGCYVIVLLNSINDLPLIITETVLAIILVFLCLLLPDVDGRELPDIMEDMDYFSELSKPLRWATQKTNSPSREEVEIKVYSFGSARNNLSSNSHVQERPPAQRIGFSRMCPAIARTCTWIQQKMKIG